jgi:N-methylhydantoinase A/oxoprolinase/acetone carboxylase beta subunit
MGHDGQGHQDGYFRYGGDSHVWVQEKMYVGPNRVIPLCLCANEFPSIISKLQNMDTISTRIMNDIIQPTTFFLGNGIKSYCLHASELEERRNGNP